jgi:hypothetical protein
MKSRAVPARCNPPDAGHVSRRAFLRATGVLVVGFALPDRAFAQMAPAAKAALAKSVNAADVDGFLAIGADGTITVFCGKVDLGQGLRIAFRQMVAEELGCAVDRIVLVEGDTALTPDQGPTAGSTGITRGGVQIRQAAATAREALLGLAAERLGRARTELIAVEGAVRRGKAARACRSRRSSATSASTEDRCEGTAEGPENVRSGRQADAAPGRSGQGYRRASLRARHRRRRHAVRRRRAPPSIGAKLDDVDESSVAAIPGARVVRIRDFLGVVARTEWDAMSAARMLKAHWSGGGTRRRCSGARVAARGSVRGRRDARCQRRCEGVACECRQAALRRVLLADAIARFDSGRRARSPTCATARRRSTARRRRRTASARRSCGCSACRATPCA